MSWVSHNEGQSSRYKTRITEGVCVGGGGGGGGGGSYELISLFHRTFDDSSI